MRNQFQILNKFWLLCSLMLVGLVGNVLALTPQQVFQDVITLGFLHNIGINMTIDPLEGFVRFLFFIVLFALLFKGAEMLKLGKNIAIVIALAFSLICVVFVPGTILVAAATSYATAFSMVLLGLVPAGVFLLYFMFKENHWVRLGLLVLLLISMYAMKSHLGLLSSGVGSPLNNAIDPIKNYMFSVWAFLLVWGLMIISLFSALGGAGGSTDHHPNFLKRLFDTHILQKVPGTDRHIELRHAKTEETRLLNDIAAERNEHESLVNVIQAGSLYERDVSDIGHHAGVPSQNFLTSFNAHFEAFRDGVHDLNQPTGRWQTAQRREVGEMRRLTREMSKRGISDDTITRVRAQEQTILNHFIQVRNALNGVQRRIAQIGRNHPLIHTTFEQVYTNPRHPYTGRAGLTPTDPVLIVNLPASTQATVTRAIADCNTALTDLMLLLRTARTEEESAMNATATLSQQIHRNWVLPTNP